MMNRSVKELFAGGRNNSAGSQHRRGRSLTTMSRDTHDENLDLFSKSRRSLSVASSDESDVSLKLGKLSLGSAKLAKSGMDDLLSSTDGGKHDYDWLLTPPGTPLFPSSDGNETHQVLGAPRSTSLTRTVSTTKNSRLSVTQTESNHCSRPASSSVTRSAVSSTQYNSYSLNKASTMLNTSSASVSSYMRSSSPITRSPSTARPSSPSTGSASSRSTTPSRPRPSTISSSTEKTRPSQTSRPSTPTSRPQIPANLSSPAARSNSRPSTPARRISTPSSSPVASLSAAVGRISSNGRLPAPSSRPSSPSPRVRSPSQPVILHDPLDIPPNLRTSAERPLSAGRSRPSLATSVKGNTETLSPGSLPRRNPSPINTRGRLPEQSGRSHGQSNGHAVSPPVSDFAMRKSVKTSTPVAVAAVAAVAESTGFGRNISKKSLDMAIRHMDIRNGTGSNRSGTTLFPQSIRSSTPKTQTVRASNAPSSVNTNGSLPIYAIGYITENENYMTRSQANGYEEQNGRLASKVSHIDIYESSRYDAILFKDDLKNTNWLHSIDDKSDHGLIFDNGFESLPEPFSPL